MVQYASQLKKNMDLSPNFPKVITNETRLVLKTRSKLQLIYFPNFTSKFMDHPSTCFSFLPASLLLIFKSIVEKDALGHTNHQSTESMLKIH